MNTKTKQSIAIALGTACVVSIAPLAKVDASELFSAKVVSDGYHMVGSFGKKGEGSCGEGNCGDEDGKKAKKAKDHSEGSCGEGRCGS